MSAVSKLQMNTDEPGAAQPQPKQPPLRPKDTKTLIIVPWCLGGEENFSRKEGIGLLVM